jgi:hypothetical protein
MEPGPAIGVQKGPLAGVGLAARGRSSWSRRRSDDLPRDAVLGRWDQARLLKRQPSLPVRAMSQSWVSRSRRAVVILASPNTVGHSPKVRLVVTMAELVLVEPADQVEEQLTASLGEGQIAELVEDDEVEAAEVIGSAAPESAWGGWLVPRRRAC